MNAHGSADPDGLYLFSLDLPADFAGVHVPAIGELIDGQQRLILTHELPILPPLRQSIDATLTGHLVYLVTEFGKPHSAKGFGNWFKKRCRQAGLEDLSAHGLRKLGAQRCAEAGATEHQLTALFGRTNPRQAAVYTRKANRAELES